jgi:glycosyltransferase involved in cell wall biosynthesis
MTKPHVSIGVPVYNGENYLRDALDDILAQTFRDFELVISDNGSTDATPAICREYAARDPRVRYFRYDENKGASWNFNNVFHQSRGTYFKWQCHDDRLEPWMVERCVEVLDREPEVVLCYTRARFIDASGATMKIHSDGLEMHQAHPHERLRAFRNYLPTRKHLESTLGLFRTSALVGSGLMGSIPHSDDILVAEMALRGQIRELAEPGHIKRSHPGISTEAYSLYDLGAFLDPRRKNKLTLLRVERLWEFVKGVTRAPLTLADKLRCYGELVPMVISARNIAKIREDLGVVTRKLLKRA